MRQLYVCILALLAVVFSANVVTAQCSPSPTQTFTNNTAVAIPTGPAVVSSTINVAGAPTYLYDVNITTFITHTFAADLDITITSPAGTIVTLTTDNGAGNDDVFNGTVWDDNANPSGQVPYTTNNGLVTDHNFLNLVLASPLAPEEPLGAFIGENPNGTWTITISDDLGGDGGSLNSWSLGIKGLAAAPTITSFPFTNNTAVAIPTGPAVVSSTINVAGAGTQLIDVNVLTNLTHTFAADLDITIMSPAGTIVTLTTDNGAGNDNVFNGTTWDDDANPAGQVPYTTNDGMATDHNYLNLVTATPLTPEEALAAFIGENPNGTWTITISDDLGGDGGSLDSWGLTIKTETCGPPPPPLPCGATTQTFTNNTSTPIVDVAVTTSTINVAGAPSYLYDVNLITSIAHTFAADLDITITSPAGTVVTLTTDNGAGNDNVFLGTTWDDYANPAGQVPYTTNNGLVGDHNYLNLVTATPLVPEEPLAAFIGENPNGTWTLRISDDLGGDAGNLNSWSVVIGASPNPPLTTNFGFTNVVPVPIPGGPAVVSSTINVAGAGTQLFDVNVLTNISHTFAADLDITITSPAGTVVTLTTDNGAGNDDVFAGTLWDDDANPGGQVPYTTNNGMVSDHAYTNLVVATPLTPEEALGAFFGENPNGTWTITISDDLGGDGGTLNSWGLNLQTFICAPPCAGVPSPGAISGPGVPVCAGTPVNLNVTGYSVASGLTFQWKSSAVPGGPYNIIAGATSPAYSFNAVSTAYYIVTVTCSNPGGGSANTVEFPVRVSVLVHSNVIATPSVVCSPGATVITGTVSGSAAAGNYTHTLTGPGTIGAAVVSGANNSNVSFSVSGLPAGIQNFTLTSTDPIGCTVATNVAVTVNQTPIVTIATTPPVVSVPCTENFDGVTAPALPAGWFVAVGASCANTARWNTVSTSSVSAPNSAFVNDPNCISDEYLISKTYNITAGSQLTFSRSNDLESTFDGLVLEISINGGAYTDIITAGGSFVVGGYNGTISSSFGSPIGGRQAWTGNSGGYVTTTINLPAAANGQPVQLRFRRATDSSVAATGANIDNISITNAGCGSVTVCNGSIVRIDASAIPPSQQTFSSLANTHIPAGGNTQGVADLYPNPITVSGIVPTNATVKSVTLNSFSHAFPDDVDIVLVSPSGTQYVILMSDAGGATAATGQTFTFDDAAGPSLADAAFNASGTYKPTNYGAGDSWPAPGPLGAPSSTTLSTFTGPVNGVWKLYVFDDAANNTGFIATWSITFNVPAPVVFSPLTNLFTDALATNAYTGTPTYTVWAKPTAVNSTYTATATVNGCTGSASVGINLIFPPVITTHPLPASQIICPGFNVVYTVSATGAGLTYQWRKNGVNLVNAGFISGVTTNTLTIATVGATDAGSYDVVVSGTCTPPATSNPAVLIIATPPTITTQPVAQTVCVGTNATFSVVAAGVPTPNIFQWQVSTDNGVTWSDLTTNGSYTSTLTVPNPTNANNGRQYRVRITNNCGGAFLFSNAVLLTVNPFVQAIATDLWNQTICLSDTLVPLVGTPIGGSWSGNGVSGFNFVPSTTGVGTYLLTYTYTGNAGLGCTSTDTTKVIVRDCGERIRLLRDDAVLLYPNPNNGHFNIKVNSTLYNYLGMKVYDMSGRLLNGKSNGKVLESPVFGGLVYGRVVPIDLSYLPSGTYLVKFYYDDGIRSSEKGFLVVIVHD